HRDLLARTAAALALALSLALPLPLLRIAEEAVEEVVAAAEKLGEVLRFLARLGADVHHCRRGDLRDVAERRRRQRAGDGRAVHRRRTDRLRRRLRRQVES